MSDFLTLTEALTIHDVMIEEFGGSPGVRDLGALEAALFRPQTGYYDDIVDEAAALMESLLQNHPFIDGNKRVAVAAADVFLRLNGVRLAIDDGAAHTFLITLMERGDMSRERLVKWLRAHVTSS